MVFLYTGNTAGFVEQLAKLIYILMSLIVSIVTLVPFIFKPGTTLVQSGSPTSEVRTECVGSRSLSYLTY